MQVRHKSYEKIAIITAIWQPMVPDHETKYEENHLAITEACLTMARQIAMIVFVLL